MTLQKIEFEYDIPDGYRFVRYGKPKKGNSCLADCGQIIVAECDYDLDWIIVEKIPEEEQLPQNTKRHKHADLIHAWADGEKIQYKCGDNWNDIKNPNFLHDIEYRIKPKTKTVRFRNYMRDDERDFVYSTQVCINEDGVIWLGDWQEVEVEE